jgi:hypothetical protein
MDIQAQRENRDIDAISSNGGRGTMGHVQMGWPWLGLVTCADVHLATHYRRKRREIEDESNAKDQECGKDYHISAQMFRQGRQVISRSRHHHRALVDVETGGATISTIQLWVNHENL